MINAFEDALSGGHPNSLGNTVAVVEEILADKNKLQLLYDCYLSNDEVVRLRVSSAFKRICKAQPDWLLPYVDRFLTEISQIDQASTQWTFAQLMMLLDPKLSDNQRDRALTVMQRNLSKSDDWIVLNITMEALTKQVKYYPELSQWLKPHLAKHAKDSRKSVAHRAQKYKEQLY